MASLLRSNGYDDVAVWEFVYEYEEMSYDLPQWYVDFLRLFGSVLSERAVFVSRQSILDALKGYL